MGFLFLIAFNACKQGLKEEVPALRAPPSMRIAIERIARRQGLKRENTELLIHRPLLFLAIE